MSFSPACRWVGWQHYIQCRPSQHHRSRPHTSPLASGSLVRTRWCTGFIQRDTNREHNCEPRWKMRGTKVEQVHLNKSVVDNNADDKSVDRQSAENLFAPMSNVSFIDPKQGFVFFRETLDALGHFASRTSLFFAPSKGTKPGTRFCLAGSDETGSNSV